MDTNATHAALLKARDLPAPANPVTEAGAWAAYAGLRFTPPAQAITVRTGECTVELARGKTNRQMKLTGV